MKAIAIGGPRDGHVLESDKYVIDFPTLDGGKFTYGWHSCAGVYYWTSPNQDMPLSAIMRKLVERYGQFRDFASGKTLEVINTLADKVQELETRDAGWNGKVRYLQDKVDEQKILLDGRDQAIHAANEDNNELIYETRETRAVLKSAGHKHEGRPLSDLVDIAIDTERTRHGETISKIAEACGISFAIGSNYQQMADVIVNALRSRFEKKLVAMQAQPAGEDAVTGAHRRLDGVEKRLAIIEQHYDDVSAGLVLDKIMAKRYGIEKR